MISKKGKQMKKALNILSIILGLAWIWFYYLDWKIALAVFLVMFSNNLMLKAQDY
jgi:hypothetical protein